MAQRLFFRCSIGGIDIESHVYEITATLTRRSDNEWLLEPVILGTGRSNYKEGHRQSAKTIRTPTSSVRQAKDAAIDRLKFDAAVFLGLKLEDLSRRPFTEGWIDQSD